MNLLISGDWFRSEHMIKANPSLPQDYSIKVGGKHCFPQEGLLAVSHNSRNMEITISCQLENTSLQNKGI